MSRISPSTTAARIRKLSRLRPRLAMILGSGFNHVLGALKVETAVPYAKLPGFPKVGVAGHAGKLLLGKLGGTPVLVLSGRAHFYEGHPMEHITFPTRVLAEFGIESLLVTNAAGGINPRFRPGDFMRLTDHINLMGANPLRGPLAEGRERFVDLSHAYDVQLSEWLHRAARVAKATLQQGVYLAVSGPSYETPAEISAFGTLGADAVGMSTVPEVIVARQCGMRVAGLSCITNVAAGLSKDDLSHHEVLETTRLVGARASVMLEHFAKLYGQNAG
ncbi:MAG: purine-nucleoside phosphorylase [Verrucomicrobia bacterium]|nr:purine-nucleoside phosphorylase [Verrucomicrobiota bacterium]